MLRHLITGPTRELEYELFELITKEKKEPLKPLVVLVGSNILGLHLRRKLASSGFSHAGIHFLTFPELAYDLINHKTGVPWSSEIGLIVTTELLSLNKDQDYFSNFLNKKSLAPVLHSLFEELENGSFMSLHQGESHKLQGIGQHFNDYKQYRAGFYHATDILREAKFEIFEKVYGTKELFVYGFSDLNQVQKDFLTRAIEKLNVDILVHWEDKLAYRYTEEYVEWLKSYDPLKHKIIENKTEDSFLGFVKRNLWRDSEVVKADSSLRIFAAISSVAECKEIVREVIDKAEAGVPFYQMAILTRDHGQYRKVLRRQLDRLNIPYYMSKAVKLKESFVVTSYLDLLKLELRGWQRDDVLSWLIQYSQSVYNDDVDEDIWNAFASYISDWEVDIKQLRSYAGKKTLTTETFLGRYGMEEEYLRYQLELFVAGFSFLQEVVDRLPKKATWVEWADISYDLVSTIYIVETEDREKLLAIFKKIQTLETTRKIGLEELIDTVNFFVNEQYLPQGKFGDGVFVGSVMEARGLSFEYIFVPGMLNDSFPLRAKENPLLNDRERQLINDKDRSLSLKANRGKEERYLFSLLLGSADKGILFTYPRFDMVKGKVQTPSAYLVDIGKMVSNKDINSENLYKLDIVSWQSVNMPLEDPMRALDETEFNLVLLESYSGYASVLKNSDQLIAGYDRAYSAVYKQSILSPYEGIIGKIEFDSVSVSGLETYAQCPMKYFFSRVLDLKVTEEDNLWRGLDSLDKGHLVHKILETFYDKKEFPLYRDRLGEYLNQLTELVDYELAVYEKQMNSGLYLSERERLIGDLQGWLLMAEGVFDEPFVPGRFELPVEFVHGGIVLRGRIDRLDFGSNGGFILVDYKTGKSFSGKDNSLQQGEALQLPLYLLAIQQKYGLDLEQGEARYVGVSRSSQYRIVRFQGQEVLEKREELDKVLDNLLAGMKQGVFHFYPGQHCRFCDYRYMCNQDKRLFDSKKADLHLQRFLSVKEVE